ncbi:hypothetical protein CISG_03060 [Coccidioides immitis RMSCC 3703]|uniref:Uncharacterized protein n=2 Tax=Coccidioides immitis TaxID=5501 RepID=A0A0J8TFJ6_COCIT|nr:hypothetical protein CIRG_08009 [Coccidioides immitis RMSCC 2394]KMU72412.1 hypothetical protein CISG_03060 [Coccidioides immitis RMSCC 3703]
MDHGDIEDPDVQMPQIKGTPLPKQARVMNSHDPSTGQLQSRLQDMVPCKQALLMVEKPIPRERENSVEKDSHLERAGDRRRAILGTEYGKYNKKISAECRAANKMTNKVLVPNQDWC